MTAARRLEKAQKTFAVVRRELERAIALEALYARCASAPDILETMEHSMEGRGFLMVRDAIHRDLTVTLMGIVERGQERTACLGVLLGILDDAQVVDALKRSGATAGKDADAFIAAARQAYSALHVEQTMKALRTLRDKVIVHVERGDVKHGAKVGDARKVLEKVVPIVQNLGRALGRGDLCLPARQERWARHADRFWRHVARSRG
jgi:hypothetical protein